MLNELLELKTGQLLKILPFSKNNLYVTEYSYYIRELGKWFIDADIRQHFKMDFSEWRNKINNRTRYYTIVEYKNELKLIKFGRSIKTTIDEQYGDDFNYLQVVVEMEDSPIGPLRSYDKCQMTINYNDKYDLNKYIDSDEYKNLIIVYNNHTNKLQLKNNHELLKYLLDNEFISQDYKTLFRSIKLKKLQNLINRRKIINEILHEHINTNTDYTKLITTIED